MQNAATTSVGWTTAVVTSTMGTLVDARTMTATGVTKTAAAETSEPEMRISGHGRGATDHHLDDAGMEGGMRVIGFAGWSGAGKTTLLRKLIPALTADGYSVSTIKHAHHRFDVDTPGKDSWEHRQAGAREVLVGSSHRWALMHELRGEAEPGLAELLARLSPVDFVLVEGFKHGEHPKIEVHRQANGKPFLCLETPSIVAIITDEAAASPIPHVQLDDVSGAVALVLAHAVSV